MKKYNKLGFSLGVPLSNTSPNKSDASDKSANILQQKTNVKNDRNMARTPSGRKRSLIPILSNNSSSVGAMKTKNTQKHNSSQKAESSIGANAVNRDVSNIKDIPAVAEDKANNDLESKLCRKMKLININENCEKVPEAATEIACANSKKSEKFLCSPVLIEKIQTCEPSLLSVANVKCVESIVNDETKNVSEVAELKITSTSMDVQDKNNLTAANLRDTFESLQNENAECSKSNTSQETVVENKSSHSSLDVHYSQSRFSLYENVLFNITEHQKLSAQVSLADVPMESDNLNEIEKNKINAEFNDTNDWKKLFCRDYEQPEVSGAAANIEEKPKSTDVLWRNIPKFVNELPQIEDETIVEPYDFFVTASDLERINQIFLEFGLPKKSQTAQTNETDGTDVTFNTYKREDLNETFDEMNQWLKCTEIFENESEVTGNHLKSTKTDQLKNNNAGALSERTEGKDVQNDGDNFINATATAQVLDSKTSFSFYENEINDENQRLDATQIKISKDANFLEIKRCASDVNKQPSKLSVDSTLSRLRINFIPINSSTADETTIDNDDLPTTSKKHQRKHSLSSSSHECTESALGQKDNLQVIQVFNDEKRKFFRIECPTDAVNIAVYVTDIGTDMKQLPEMQKYDTERTLISTFQSKTSDTDLPVKEILNNNTNTTSTNRHSQTPEFNFTQNKLKGVFSKYELKAEPIWCPISNCGQIMFPYNIGKHFQNNHDMTILERIDPNMNKYTIIDPKFLKMHGISCNFVYLLSGKIRNFGRADFKNLLPILVLTTKIHISYILNFKSTVDKAWFLMVWLAGLVPINTKINFDYVVTPAIENEISRISGDGEVISLHEPIDLRKIFYSSNSIVFSGQDVRAFTENGQQAIKLKISFN